jgi:hypothetical protein
MKKYEDYVCTYEQSVILMDLKINDDSLFYWVVNDTDAENEKKFVLPSTIAFDDTIYIRNKKLIPAYTSQELIEIIARIGREFDCELLDDYMDDLVCCYEGEHTEAKDRADFLISNLRLINEQAKEITANE